MHRYVLTSVGRELKLQEMAGCDPGKFTSPLLVSGFNRQSPDISSPLSPSLQINADLTPASCKQLSRLAIAERNRLLANRRRNYVYTVEPRVAVIAADPLLLADFIDIYGGIFATVPVLFSSKIQPEYIPAAELDILSAAGGGYRVRCTARSPIDRQVCTWCRACIAACGKQCITPELEIDFGRCTLCGDCVDACPVKAVDLDARAVKEFKVPAIILLGEPAGIKLPAAREMIFRGPEVEAFLRQVGEHQVEETVVYQRELCQYCGRLDLGCRQCLEACTHSALSRDGGGISIDYLVCQDCGACVAACPTGALQDQRFNDRSFFTFFGELELDDPRVAILGSADELFELWWYHHEKSREPFFLEYPRVQALTAMHFLFLFALGFSRVVLLENAENVAENLATARELRLAQDILQHLFAVSDFILTTTGRDFSRAPVKAGKNPLKKVYDDFSFAGRRQKLSSLLQFLLTAAETVGTKVIEPLSGAKYSPTYGRIRCAAEKCSACAACLNECHTGALTTDPQAYTLNHEPALCVQCGICVAVCPEQALTLEPGLVLRADFFQSQILSRAEPMICKECGAHFGTRKSYQHVIDRLRATGHFAEQEEVLSYCETCRAVKMFEAYVN